MAAQDGVIMTRAYQSRVLKKSVNPMCRKCHKRPETISHTLAHGEKYSWTLYKDRHDQVVGVLYYHLCTHTYHRMDAGTIPWTAELEISKQNWKASVVRSSVCNVT